MNNSIMLTIKKAATKIQSMARHAMFRRRMIQKAEMKRIRHDQSVQTNILINIVRSLLILLIIVGHIATSFLFFHDFSL